MAEEEEIDQENDEAEKKGGISTLKIVIISVVLALVVGGGLVAATLYFVNSMDDEQTTTAEDGADEATEEDEDEAVVEEKAPPNYHSMDPKFVVSFSNQKSARFMQFSLEVMSRDSEVIKVIEAHAPVIRSSLLMLVGVQTYEDMVTREGKERLLADIVADINATLERISGDTKLDSTVEAAYFNSFVIQ